MANDTAKRQAAYRARHLTNEDSDLVRLNLLIDFHVKLALERLASCHGVTQRAMLERLIRQGQQALLAGLDGQAQDAYYDRLLKLPQQGVTR